MVMGEARISEQMFSNMELTFPPRRFLLAVRRLHFEVAQISIGVNNEYFLHHWRRGRNSFRCRILWAARLNE
jgi:hypothetical protein